MRVVVDGQDYEYDAGRLLIREAMEVQEKTDMNLLRWQQGLNDMDPVAVLALVYLLKKRAGEQPDFDTLDFDLGSLEMHEEQGEVPKDEADPDV